MEMDFPRRLYFETANLDPREGRPSIALRMHHESGDDVSLVELRPPDNAEHLRLLNFLTDRYHEIIAAFDWDRVRIRELFEAAGFVLEAETPKPLNIFEAIDMGDVRKKIDVVDPAFEKAAGIEIADGRPSPKCPKTGQPMFRGVRPMTITYQGRQAAFDMPGWYCDTSNQSIHTGEDLEVSDRALDQLKAEVAADDTSPRNKTKFEARPQLLINRKDLIERAFDGFERTFEGLADRSEAHCWRSIHIAPRDGSWILLSGGSIGFGWEGETQPNCVVGQFGSSEVNGPCWQFTRYDSGHYGEYEAPTHWMPLPELVPDTSNFGPGGRFCANALVSAADLAMIEAAFPLDVERPEFEIPRFWSNRDLCDPDTIIALVLRQPTTEDPARTIVAYGPRRLISVLERGAQNGELSAPRVARAYEWLGPILKGITAAAHELIEHDFADKLLRMKGTIGWDIDLEFNDEPAIPHLSSFADWFRTHQPSGFAGKTILQLIEEGRVSDVLDYLDAIEAGGFA